MNASFEKTTNMNCFTGPILNVDDWAIIQSPDYFITSCNGIGNSGIPNNNFGFCFPKHGNAYVGIATLGLPHERKEYIYQHLINPLIAGKSYYTSFFLSKSDRTRIATEKIGTYFSATQPTVAAGTTVCLLATPQVENQSGFLTDTINWVKIEGYFKAQGGEEYITIGNFNSNADTDTLHTGTTNPFFADAGGAYYYIDSVSLYDSLDYAIITNIENNKSKLSFAIYPNPATDKVRVIINASTPLSMTNIKITDVVGRKVKEMEYEEEIDISDLEKGIYFVSLEQSGKTLGTKKFVKE